MSGRKTHEELATLKEGWLAYPYWVLENAEGFDAHRAELRQFRLDTNARQESDRVEQPIQTVVAHEREEHDFLKDAKGV